MRRERRLNGCQTLGHWKYDMKKIILFLMLMTMAFSQDGGWDGDSWYVPDTLSADQGKISGTMQFVPEATQTLAAATQITLDGMFLQIESDGGAVTLTSTPTIETTDNKACKNN